MRTFIVADAHGYPELIKNALEHGEFEPGQDGFVYAGDLFDRGPDARGCIELVQAYATEVVVGNHDLAVLLDFLVYPSNPENREFRPFLIDAVINADPEEGWKLATEVDGILITHGGISSEYEGVFLEECNGDPGELAEHLNREFSAAVRAELKTGEWDDGGILGDAGPTWFRPGPWSSRHPLGGIRQVVGHTPPVPELEAEGFYMVDPCAFYGMGDPRRFRYVIIEDGDIQVYEGTLGPTRSDDPPGQLAAVLC